METVTSTHSNGNLLLHAALRYAARGWRVLLLHALVMHGGCSCGKAQCGSPGKHPRLMHGVKDATSDPIVIQRWWEQWPAGNLGIATGGTSGIVVVDVDGAAGAASLAEWPPLPMTREVTTGRGYHLYFDARGCRVRNRVGILPGVDVRADRGYIVAPPSQHYSGHRYRWRTRLPLAPLPDWLTRILRDSSPSSATADADEMVIAAGYRNATLTSLAGTMRRRGMSAASIAAALLVENQLRCLPPLSDAEVRQIAYSIGRYRPAESDDFERAVAAALSGDRQWER